ncbi:peptidoglycan-binding protein [Streptomyces sp. NPDC046866]|uniref:peptidoglycan-binding protein n=1 Tax=Streptomyces sp. NPDC046866 TaxID=3154921 RepID=UPI003454F5C2
MPTPVFEEYEPAGDCACPGCVQRRRSLARARAIPLRDGGHPAARGARRALVLATAAGVVLGGGGSAALAAHAPVGHGQGGHGQGHGQGQGQGHGEGRGPGEGRGHAPAANPRPTTDPAAGRGPASGPEADAGDEPATPQGTRAPLHGRPAPGKPAGLPGSPSTVKRLDRTTIINRAKLWLDAKVPYSMSSYWTDGYRQDCSGYVSMAWNLGSNEWTGSLDKFATKITKDELLPGDMLLFHNPENETNGSHVVLFGGWVDETKTHYTAYEQTRPNTRRAATPYGYWTNASKYVPYRYLGVTGGLTVPDPGTGTGTGTGTDPKPVVPPTTAFPGADKFGPGADNEYVAQLGRMLIDRGGRRFYPNGVSTKWSNADLLATTAFQTAQGWTGADADGIPGPETWRLLVERTGKDIRPTVDPASGPKGTPAHPGRPVPKTTPGPTATPGPTTPSATPGHAEHSRPSGSTTHPAHPRPSGAPGHARPSGTSGHAGHPQPSGTATHPAATRSSATAGPAEPSGQAGPSGRPAAATAPAYPGAWAFRPGSTHPSITALGRRLVEKGFGKHYTTGPGPSWSEAHRRNVEAFQRAQGWRGATANGYPGPETWRRLFA